ncbi:unnamed protein product [Ambrosiozyma monospora]|uniref:Unnamed protein product n=1 Tax=Ambrosiozyma monospora TaxID=43982 RepID=A0ACB5U9U0_AMBMO|nr:unnamed protein product [Ambrosiozyma monospora]
MRLSYVPLFGVLAQLAQGLSIPGDIVDAIKRANSPGYLKMSAKKSYADSAAGIVSNSTTGGSNSKSVPFLQRSTGKSDDNPDWTLKNQAVFYSVDVAIGSKGNVVTVLVDTGSSDFWVMSSKNPYCISDWLQLN